MEAISAKSADHLLIEGYLEGGLREEGGEFVGLCPFHQEQTPTLKVYTDGAGKTWFKCFGCGEHGDAVAFIMAFSPRKIEGR
jgi:DNA primase